MSDSMKLKQSFTSRWEDGVIVSLDLSQIEIVGLAFLSQDKQLIEDLKNGLDMHCQRLSSILKKSYETVYNIYKDETHPDHAKIVSGRIKAKEFSFQRSYGAGVTAIANSTGLTIAEVNELIKEEERRYHRVQQWYQELQQELEHSPKETFRGEVYGIYTNPLGNTYSIARSNWLGFDVTLKFPYKAKEGFNIPTMKNYKVQGFAADILKLLMSIVYNNLIGKENKCIMINNIHDEIIFDCKEEYLSELKSILEECMEHLHNSLSFLLKREYNVPIKHTIKVGKTWGDLE